MPETAATDAATNAAAGTDAPTGLTPEDRTALEAIVAKERANAKAESKKARDAQAQLDKITEANQSETEKAIAQARKEAAAETTGTFRSKILNAEIRAQAAGRFSNARLAPKLLDLDPEAVFGDDGEPDTKAIVKAIDDFLAEDENAGLRASGSTRPAGDADGGKGNGAPAGDMNEYIRAGIKRR